MFNPSREQVRQLFFDTWRKYRQKEILSGIENIALEVILLHPEYQEMLDNSERYRDKNYFPEMGETNPFLHMSMHIAIKEQLSIDQPVGIRKKFELLLKKTGNEHDATHLIIECLAEMLWQAQRNQTPPDAQIYFDCLDKWIGKLDQ
ncbi:DUF1841 family protein [Nitrosomonas sp. Is37]|uniref:DUF1841 family protein n=1 Tax=Nitrosomonas sp. Is37 TaxID=3080535 RepID=UPI00294B018C|nr:DUF1841 family protein [Nitrosomonas sp. Is37]MDV6345444.1 DUF1841 family protein [Nitrosomonas sp. Is37]